MISRFLSTSLLLVFALAAFSPASVRAQNEIEKDIEKLEKFLKNLDQNYVDEVETKAIVEEGMRRMLEELDPHSVYWIKMPTIARMSLSKGSSKALECAFS